MQGAKAMGIGPVLTTSHTRADYDRAVRQRANRLRRRHLEHPAPYEVEFAGFRLRMDSGVFNPILGEGARLFAANAPLIHGSRVLDMGTGSGALALLASLNCESVVAADVVPAAVACAQHNVSRAGLAGRVAVRESDLFGSLEGEPFDLILFNPPFLDGPQSDSLDRAIFDRHYETLGRFCASVRGHLAPGGSVLLCFSDTGHQSFLHWAATRAGLTVRRVGSTLSEGLFTFELLELRGPE